MKPPRIPSGSISTHEFGELPSLLGEAELLTTRGVGLVLGLLVLVLRILVAQALIIRQCKINIFFFAGLHKTGPTNNERQLLLYDLAIISFSYVTKI